MKVGMNPTNLQRGMEVRDNRTNEVCEITDIIGFGGNATVTLHNGEQELTPRFPHELSEL